MKPIAEWIDDDPDALSPKTGFIMHQIIFEPKSIGSYDEVSQKINLLNSVESQ